MRRLLLVALAACGHAPPHQNTESFDALSNRVLDHLYHASPAFSVGLGFHDYDGKLPDITPAATAALIATYRADQQALEHYEPRTPLEREQRDTLLINVHGNLFSLVDQDALHTNPMNVVGDFNLDAYIIRDYAEPAVRAAAVVRLCSQAKTYLEQARTGLVLPIPRVWLETAIMEFKGLSDFANKDVRGAFTTPPAELGPALDACHAAFDAHVAWLEQQLPKATDAFALGKERFVKMLGETEGIHTDLATLERMAKADLDRNTHAIEAAAHEIDPNRPVADVVAEVMKDRPTPATVLAVAEKQATEMRQFLIDHHIVTVPGDELALVRETPSFARWNSASLSSAGPFEPKPLASYYYISPPDPSWTPEVQTAYIPSTMNLLFTTIHEVYPGHFINALHLARITSKVEKSLWSYTTGEGWAHYTEEMMYDEGAGGHTPRAHIGQLTEALLRNVRFVVALGEHTGGMSTNDAEQLFITRAFLDEGNAKQQAARGTFDPMYLAYTVGKLAIMKLRTDWKLQHPTGTLQEFHDEFLAHGAAPLPVIRRAMVGDDNVL
ncbi:MAG: DUF885 domain-containing protein [Kofleriaceae bacterium]